MSERCPICNGVAVKRCRCPRSDAACMLGHKWHTCTVHRVAVLGHSGHDKDFGECTCVDDSAPASDELARLLRDYEAERVAHAETRAQLAAMTARHEAGYRVLTHDYLPWTHAGGPSECMHGVNEGIPCEHCDRELVLRGTDRVCKPRDEWKRATA
jgi:hypothetical protein